MTRPNRLIGQKMARVEDERFLRGAGCYVGDLRRPGLLHAVFVRAPIAHGIIRRIDATAARAMPGIAAIILPRDIAAVPGQMPRIPVRQESLPELGRYTQPVIAAGVVRYVGEPLAVVLAENPALAEDAADSVVVEIDPLPPVASWQAATGGDSLLFPATGSNDVLTLTAASGDADAAFAGADYVREADFSIQRHSAMMLEPRGLLAEWDAAAGHLTLHGAAKVAFPNRRLLAKLLDLPEDAVTLIENDVGGGFGVRGEFYPEDFLIPFAARHVGRPVRWLEDRREHMLAANQARELTCRLAIACRRDGTILGLRGTAHADIGAYVRTAGATPARNVAQVLAGPYRIADMRLDITLHVTNKTPVGTYRGPGRFEADFCRERLLDMAAADLGLDRVAFRRSNLIGATQHPWTLPMVEPLHLGGETDSGDYAQTLERCLERFGWPEKSQLSGRNIDGAWHGIAVGCYFEGGAGGPREHARLVLRQDGRIAVFVGSSGIGQGVETVFTQIAADALDVPADVIGGVFHGSTDLLAEGFGSYSSRSTVLGGSAILDAAARLRSALCAAAAGRLGCAADDVVYDAGLLRGPAGASLTFADLADAGIAADGVFASTKRTYSYGAHAAHVAVDAATGLVRVLDYAAVEDVGRAINPMTLHGQTFGCVAQGIGGALFEQFLYDDQAQPLSGTLADYLLPTAPDVPRIDAEVLQNHPSPHNPLGAKGAGEGGIIPVGGVVANAVADALRGFGVEPTSLPLSPQVVRGLLREAGR